MKRMTSVGIAWIAVMAVSLPALAEGELPAPPSIDPIGGGKASLAARLRYEDVDQANGLESAQAYTLRARLGFTTAPVYGLDASVEFEGVTAVDPADYNSTANGKTGYSVVADPEGSEWNQAWLRFSGIPQTTLKAGRQRVILDNARFIGNVGWRQNEATYDGALLTTQALPRTTVTTLHLTDVNSITFTDIELKASGLNVQVAAAEALKLTGYGYWLDFDLDSAARRDTRTVGGRLSGQVPVGAAKLLYAAEFADQSAYAESPSTVDAQYLAAEAGVKVAGVTAKLGYEALGGDGVYGFQTPLATLHAFQGWADVFLATPAAGVRDATFSLGGSLWDVGLLGVWHEFSADSGGADYGTELDLQATRKLPGGFSSGVKYADYQSDGYAVDTRKLWLWFEYGF